MWTLAVEVQFYVLLPVLGGLALLLRRSGRLGLLVPAALLVGAGIAFAAWALSQPGSIVIMDSLPVAAPAFGCGMAVAVLSHDRRLPAAHTLIAVAGGILLVVLNGVWHEAGAGRAGLLWRDVPACAGFALIVLAVVNGRLGWLRARPLLALGTVSFGVYLWHMPVMLVARAAGVFPEGEPVLAVLVVSALTLPIAWLSWVCVERPFVRHRSSRPGPALGVLATERGV